MCCAEPIRFSWNIVEVDTHASACEQGKEVIATRFPAHQPFSEYGTTKAFVVASADDILDGKFAHGKWEPEIQVDAPDKSHFFSQPFWCELEINNASGYLMSE